MSGTLDAPPLRFAVGDRVEVFCGAPPVSHVLPKNRRDRARKPKPAWFRAVVTQLWYWNMAVGGDQATLLSRALVHRHGLDVRVAGDGLIRAAASSCSYAAFFWLVRSLGHLVQFRSLFAASVFL